MYDNTFMFVQGNFFQNIGSICLFAVIGTAISAFVVGGGIYFLGQVCGQHVFYHLEVGYHQAWL